MRAAQKKLEPSIPPAAIILVIEHDGDTERNLLLTKEAYEGRYLKGQEAPAAERERALLESTEKGGWEWVPGQGREMKYCGSAQELADFLRGFCNDGTDPVFDREGSSPDCLDAAGRITGSLDRLLLAPKYEADGCGGIEGEIAVSLEECIACGSTGFGTAEFLDLAARRLAGSPCLTDVNYEAVRCTGKGRIVLKVNGFFL